MTNEQVQQSIEKQGIGTRNQQVEEIERMMEQKGGQGGGQAQPQDQQQSQDQGQSQDRGPRGEVMADGAMGTATADPEADSLEELREEVGLDTGQTATH